MFLTLASLLSSPEDVLRTHPLQLSRWLDAAWTSAAEVPALPAGSPAAPPVTPSFGDPGIVAALGLPTQTPPTTLLPSGIDVTDATRYQHETEPAGTGFVHHHLVYAYLLESTGLWEIFAALVQRLVVGESLGQQLSPDASRWLRATEEMFFRDPPLYSIVGVTSALRPDDRTGRRNAYWRMFGLDLPHQPPGGGAEAPWKRDVGAGVNRDFRPKWSELLRQVWLGLENDANTSGLNPTDEDYVALLCSAIGDMCNDRRRGGMLAREEFAYVTALSWFHLTLLSNTPILTSLTAQAASPEERLARLGSLVGKRPSQRSRELFLLTEPMSMILRAIENGVFDTGPNAITLFDAATLLGQDMRNIINNWQSATGERVKERPSGTIIGTGSQPLRIPTPGDASPPTAPTVRTSTRPTGSAPGSKVSAATNGRSS